MYVQHKLDLMMGEGDREGHKVVCVGKGGDLRGVQNSQSIKERKQQPEKTSSLKPKDFAYNSQERSN